jgi:hypothetical protein
MEFPARYEKAFHSGIGSEKVTIAVKNRAIHEVSDAPLPASGNM